MWKIQLTIPNYFISSIDNVEERVIPKKKFFFRDFNLSNMKLYISVANS